MVKLRPRRVYFDIKKKTPYIVKNGKRVFIRLKKDGGGNGSKGQNTTIDHRTIKDKRQIVKVIVNTTKPHEVKSRPRRKRRIILAKKEEQTTKAGNDRTIYVPQYMPFPGHSQQPITVNIREGGKDKEKSVVPTPVNVNRPEGITIETQTEGTSVNKPEGITIETQTVEGSKYDLKDSTQWITGPDKERLMTIYNAYGISIPKGDRIGAVKLLKYLTDNHKDIIDKSPIEIENMINEKRMDPNISVRYNPDVPTTPSTPEWNPMTPEGKQQGNGKSSVPKGKGLTTKEINKLMKDEGYDVVKAIPSDCIPELVNDVNKKTEKFGFIINNEPHTQPGEHWRACFIDIPEGNVCWFDSLCGEPTRKEMKGIKVLIDKINPEYYLKFKINRIKLQGDTTNCGWFCCKFIDDMMSGKKFKEATGWDVVNGECGVENYKEKHGCAPERWGCI